MRLLLLVLASIPVGAITIWAFWPKRDVSRTWLVESERRQWREGVEGVAWRWPVRR